MTEWLFTAPTLMTKKEHTMRLCRDWPGLADPGAVVRYLVAHSHMPQVFDDPTARHARMDRDATGRLILTAA